MAADLVVVRLDVRVGEECLVDTFCWCAADRDRAAMHAFAATLVQDAGLPAAFVAPVVDAMWTQISNDVRAGESSVTRATANERLEKIQLDVSLAGTRVTDQVEWDVNQQDSDTVAFAAQTAKDLGLHPAYGAMLCANLQDKVRKLRRMRSAKARHAVPSANEERLAGLSTGLSSSCERAGGADKPRNIYLAPPVRRKEEWRAWEPHVQQVPAPDQTEAQAPVAQTMDAQATDMTTRGQSTTLQRPIPMPREAVAGQHGAEYDSMTSVLPSIVRTGAPVGQGNQADSANGRPAELSIELWEQEVARSWR